MVAPDCKVAQSIVDVWRSASTIHGAQCVMINGIMLMLKLRADN